MKPHTHSRVLPRYLVLLAALLCASTPYSSFAQASSELPEGRASSVREQLIGSWRLVSRESRRSSGELVPDAGLATVPLGLLIYDRSGHVAARLSRQDRTMAMLPDECRLAIETKGTPDTAQTVLGYDAYFGTYTIDEKSSIVTHHLTAAIFPGDIGKDIKRRFTLSGNRLTIAFDTTTRDAVHVTRTLVWERLE
jgi:Lipocalin-like domain